MASTMAAPRTSTSPSYASGQMISSTSPQQYRGSSGYPTSQYQYQPSSQYQQGTTTSYPQSNYRAPMQGMTPTSAQTNQRYQPAGCNPVPGPTFSFNMQPMYPSQQVSTFESQVECRVTTSKYGNWWYEMTNMPRNYL